MEFPEDVWERIKAFRPRCSPTAMCIKRYMAAHTLSDGHILLPLYGDCDCGRRACETLLSPDVTIKHFRICYYCDGFE